MAPRHAKSGAQWKYVSTMPTVPSSTRRIQMRTMLAWEPHWWSGYSGTINWSSGILATLDAIGCAPGFWSKLPNHSLLQEQMDAGLITPEQAVTSSIKNLVTRALGVDDSVLLEVNEHVVQAGDIYLMCSDGLSDMIDDGAIAKIVAEELTLDQKASQLIDLANENGGRDNISVLLVAVHEAPEKRGLIARWLGK